MVIQKTDTKKPNLDVTRRLHKERKYVDALNELNSQIANYGLPSSPEDFYICARVYRDNDNYEKAIQFWESFFSLNPENYSRVDALNEMALCYSRLYRTSEALAIYDKLLSISPRDKYALFGKSVVLLKEERLEEAKALLQEALKIYPDDIRMIDQYAKVLQKFRRYEEAIGWYQKELKYTPDSFFAWSGLFECFKALGENTKVEEVLRKLSALAGKDIRVLDSFVRGLFRSDGPQLAAEFLEAIDDIKISDSNFLQLAGEVYLEQGTRANDEIYYQKALDKLKYAESISRVTQKKLINRIGICYLYLGYIAEAEEYLRKYLSMAKFPMSSTDRYQVHQTGEALLNFQRGELAVEFFNKLLEGDPNDQYGLDGIAKAYMSLEDFDKSIAAYSRKLELNPDDIYALDGLAKVYRVTGKYEQSTKLLERLAVLHGEERTNLEARIAQIRGEKLQYEVEQFNQRKLSSLNTMTSGISHEMNQPLAIIRWNISSLIRDIEKKRIDLTNLNETLVKIDYQAKRINEILRTFKELSREHPLILKEINLSSLVEKTFDMFSNQLKIRNISVDLSRLSSSIPTIVGDEIRIEQVLMNLILNSRDALEGRKESVISCRTYRFGYRNQVGLVFQDNGPGIPIEIRGRIYDPFFTTKPVGKGTGLGLSIVFQYMQDVKGGIELDESYTDGARFRLRFKPFQEGESQVQNGESKDISRRRRR